MTFRSKAVARTSSHFEKPLFYDILTKFKFGPYLEIVLLQYAQEPIKFRHQIMYRLPLYPG